MSRLAIIPARGGSKRIPGKNTKLFLGKPIIAYSIEVAMNSGLFDEVMVSTDSEEIAEIAKEYGAKVPFTRSDNNSNDHATTFDVIAEVVQWYAGQGQQFDEVCCIYATAPFISSDSLSQALDLMLNGNFDSVFPAIAFSAPVQRAFRRMEDGKMQMLQPKHVNSRSQDLEATFYDAGQFYWLKYDRLADQKTVWTDNTGLLVIKEDEGHDIDTETDWKMAELKYKLLGSG